MYLLNELTSQYGTTDSRITSVVNKREIWIVSSVNPDGAEFDVSIGKEAQYCGLPSATGFADDFETERGWTAGTTGATAGRFERGDPAATDSGGIKQLGTTVSGVSDLVTGRRAGDHDVDGGVTSIRCATLDVAPGHLRRTIRVDCVPSVSGWERSARRSRTGRPGRRPTAR